MQVSGSAIDRVFAPPILPPRRFRGAIDAIFTLAVGSVCAFALTLGPAPLNTVAASSAAADSFAGHSDPAPDLPLLPAEIDSEDSVDDQAEDVPMPTPDAPGDAVAQSPVGAQTPKPPAAARTPQDAKQAQEPPGPPRAKPSPKAPQPQKPNVLSRLSVPELISPSAAGSVVQTFRLASGLDAFVSAEDCAQSTVHASVSVTPSALLAPGLAKKSLAPDPAYATVSGATGALTVTVHACK